jgi:hypothetical protein
VLKDRNDGLSGFVFEVSVEKSVTFVSRENGEDGELRRLKISINARNRKAQL